MSPSYQLLLRHAVDATRYPPGCERSPSLINLPPSLPPLFSSTWMPGSETPSGLPEVTQQRGGRSGPALRTGSPVTVATSCRSGQGGSLGGAAGPVTVLGFNWRPLVLLGRLSAHGQLWGRPGGGSFSGFWRIPSPGMDAPWGGRVGRGPVDFQVRCQGAHPRL